MLIENYNVKSDYFVKPYGLHKESITDINGFKKLSENITNIVGLEIGRRAYMKNLESIGGEDIIFDGYYEFTDEQFFLLMIVDSIVNIQLKAN
uniref:Phage protein n=1 Tax=Strongyloides venezuelensis TaxID=75913 RepID=A0A0K0FQF2_STRVS